MLQLPNEHPQAKKLLVQRDAVAGRSMTYLYEVWWTRTFHWAQEFQCLQRLRKSPRLADWQSRKTSSSESSWLPCRRLFETHKCWKLASGLKQEASNQLFVFKHMVWESILDILRFCDLQTHPLRNLFDHLATEAAGKHSASILKSTGSGAALWNSFCEGGERMGRMRRMPTFGSGLSVPAPDPVSPSPPSIADAVRGLRIHQEGKP